MIGTPQQEPTAETIPPTAAILSLPTPAEIDELRRLKLHGAEPVRRGREILQWQIEGEFADTADIILRVLAPLASDCRALMLTTEEPYPADFLPAYDNLRETLDYHMDQEEEVCRERTLPAVEEALAILWTELDAFQHWIDGPPPSDAIAQRLIA
jgi:hypothetical protein